MKLALHEQNYNEALISKNLHLPLFSHDYWKFKFVGSWTEYIGPLNYVSTIKCGANDFIWKRSPMSYKQVSWWFFLFHDHLTMRKLNICVWLGKVTK